MTKYFLMAGFRPLVAVSEIYKSEYLIIWSDLTFYSFGLNFPDLLI